MSAQTLLHDLSRGLRSIGAKTEDVYVGAVQGVAMRTAPFAPYPPFILPIPDGAAVALARALHERGEEVRGVNGALPAVELFAAELARMTGGRVEVSQHTRLHELGELTPPAPVPGELVAATEDDVDLALEWFAAFADDADQQAGRPRGATAHEVPDRSAMLRRIRAGELWFWVDPAGRRTGVNVRLMDDLDWASLTLVRLDGADSWKEAVEPADPGRHPFRYFR